MCALGRGDWFLLLNRPLTSALGLHSAEHLAACEGGGLGVMSRLHFFYISTAEEGYCWVSVCHCVSKIAEMGVRQQGLLTLM